MLKVLIADDNRLIRQSLRKRVDWTSLGLDCVGEAEDGQQALDLIRSLKPDIVIIDIRMPGVDGLQVMQYARGHHLGIQFILISGYDDFDYLKQAIRLQAVNYLLKPIHTPELVESLHLAAERCAKAQEEPQAEDGSKTPEAQHPNRQPALAPMQKYGVPAYSFCVCINIPQPGEGVLFPPGCIGQIEQEVRTLLFPAVCHAIPCARETLVLTIGQERAQLPSDYLLEQLQQKLQHILKSSPIFFTCSDTGESARLPVLLHQSLFRMLGRFSEVSTEGDILFATERRKLRQKLDDLMQLQLYEACRTLIEQYFQSARQEGWYPSCIVLILQFWQDCLSERNVAAPFQPNNPEVFALQFADYNGFENAFFQSFDQTFLPENQHPTADKIMAYIQLFYAEPLTLQHLAKIFHLNQAYLGQLIKKSAGLSFHTLLNQIRLEKAAQILRDNPSVMIKDLAFSLGFSDAYYFARVFKQCFGQTPSEYRQALPEADGGADKSKR